MATYNSTDRSLIWAAQRHAAPVARGGSNYAGSSAFRPQLSHRLFQGLLYGWVGNRFTGLRQYFAMHHSARKPSFMPIFLPSA